jgi:hypothetical protein
VRLGGAWCCSRPRARHPVSGRRSVNSTESTGIPCTHMSGRRGHAPEEARDLTQGFFLHLLEHKTLARADQLKGKFRSFLRRPPSCTTDAGRFSTTRGLDIVLYLQCVTSRRTPNQESDHRQNDGAGESRQITELACPEREAASSGLTRLNFKATPGRFRRPWQTMKDSPFLD